MSPRLKAKGAGDPQSSPRRPSSPAVTPNFFMGMSIQMARRYLFLDVKSKALFYLVFVAVLSIIASFFPFSMDSYWVQKHNVFNQYGVKIGWFWTCIVVGPFIWYSSKLHHKDGDRVVIDFLRLVVATFVWYLTIQTFHKVLHSTSRCDKSLRWTREQCTENGGTWIPGLDISGHCFLLIYSILIVCEEASAFRHWAQLQCGEGADARKQFQLDASIAQCAFVAMLVLHAFWDFQLIVSCLYYHILLDKILGAAAAVFAWSFTYKFLYPSGFLCPPINRKRN